MSKFGRRIRTDAQAFLNAMIWEYKFIINDRAVFFSFIMVAVGVSFLYTYLYSPETMQALNVGVVDLDNSSHSRQYLRMATASDQIQIEGYYRDLEEAKAGFSRQNLIGIIVIPSDFSKDLQRGDQPVVSVYADGSYFLYYKQIATATQKASIYMGAGVRLKKNMASGKLPEEAMSNAQPVTPKMINLYNPSSGYGTFLIPIVLIIIFQTTILTSIGILGGTMREKGLMHKLYPNSDYFLGTLPIVMGKAATYLIIGLTILLIMLGMVLPFYNIPMRSTILEVMLFMTPFLLAVVYLGLFLLSYFRQREDAIMLIMFTSIPMVFMTGFSYPIDAMPKWIEIISYLMPSTLGSHGFVGLTQMGASLSTLKDIWLGMWGVCIFYLILAVLATKRIYLTDKK